MGCWKWLRLITGFVNIGQGKYMYWRWGGGEHADVEEEKNKL